MENLRANEEQIMCPYNAAHFIRKSRMDVHLTKCRRSYEENQVMAICDFDSSHIIPQPELQYHHDTCPSRKSIELLVYSEEAATPIPVNIPAVPVPVDSSWDDEEVPSYNPQKYCEQNDILRHVDTESAAARRQFRDEERRRHNNLDPTKSVKLFSSDTSQNSRAMNKSKAQQAQIFPPIPKFTNKDHESVPADVAEMMKRMSMKPKAAVIPKTKN